MTTKTTPWWSLSPPMMIGLSILAVFSFTFTAWPKLFDLTLIGMGRLADFRDWPWWYFLELLVVAGFSVRWFFIYVALYNEELDENGKEEARRFVHLTVFLSAAMFLYTVLHRFNAVRILYGSLWRWFGIGSFSWTALFGFVLIFAAVSLLIVFLWKWITALQSN